MIEVKVEKVIFDHTSQMGIVLLGDLKGEKILPIWMGIFEAQAIEMKLKNIKYPRPLTHDLLNNLTRDLKGKIEFILVNDLRENTYFAQIQIDQNNKKLVVDSRPSDAIALAIRAGASIYLSEKVYEKTHDRKKYDEYIKSEVYKKYLESLNEDDLKKA